MKNKRSKFLYHMQRTALRYVTPFGLCAYLNMQRFHVDVMQFGTILANKKLRSWEILVVA